MRAARYFRRLGTHEKASPLCVKWGLVASPAVGAGRAGRTREGGESPLLVPRSRHYRSAAVITPLPDHCVTRSKVRVRFCDTDMMGVVHHSNYIVYFELARIEYLRKRGLDYSSWVKMGFHLPVIEVDVRYKKPAYLDDLLTVEARLTTLSRVKVGFDYRVLRDGPEGEQLLATGATLLACVGDDHAPCRMPREAEAVLLAEELRAGEIHA